MTRKTISKRFLALLAVTTLMLSLFSVGLAKEQPLTLVILHTNDVHSRVDTAAAQLGYAKIATIVKTEKTSNAHVLVLDAGDALHGQSIANLSRGESIVEMMNLVGYDAMVAGNHDFNFGQERLLELGSLADFALLGANVLRADATSLLRKYVIKEIGTKKVLIFGLSTPETTFKTHPKNVTGLTFVDPVVTARQIIAEMQDQVDFIIALSHLGQEGDYTSLMVAEQVKGIDLIIDGHSHDKETITVGDTLIVQAGEYSANLGRVEITFSNDGFVISPSRISAADASTIVEDPAVVELLSHYKAEVNAIQAIIIGSTQVHLEGTRDKVRTQETNLGNLITDAILDKSGADVALTNGGGIRVSIAVGDISRKNVFDVLPFGNLIVVKEVPGSIIMEMLEVGARLYPAANGAFLHTAGLTYSIDASKPALERVHSVILNGQPLKIDEIYLLATNDFMAAGGDGYVMLKKYPIFAEMISLEEALAEYVAKLGGSVAPKLEGRITVEPTPVVVLEPAPVVVPQPRTYIVQPGDVLWRIARQHGTTWQVLQQFNSIKNPNLIYPKQVILIPAS
ncbi:MAG: 5'-nucleotidase [Bacillota bacterium]|nr:MAG: 5'-nucleotidase [Bacillota bacterium]MBS3949614.1 5'-nucleotidase C-terminal domain-containing protein [Peptococcaceae bacterium]